jgi:hypothetical protein
MGLDTLVEDGAVLQELEKLKKDSVKDKDRIKSLSKTLDRERALADNILVDQVNRFPSLLRDFNNCTTHEARSAVLTRGIDGVLQKYKASIKIVVEHHKVVATKDEKINSLSGDVKFANEILQTRMESKDKENSELEKKQKQTEKDNERLKKQLSLLQEKLGLN